MRTAMRETSLQAYDGLRELRYGKTQLQRREIEVLTAAVAHFHGRTFTRKELAEVMGWAINRITGRVLTLIQRGELEELDERRDGSALIRIAVKQQELALA